MPTPTPAPPRDASATHRGLMGVLDQAFSGVKSFLDRVVLAKLAASSLPSGGPELEGSVVYNTTLKRAMVHTGSGWLPLVASVAGTPTANLEEHILDEAAHPDAHITYTGGPQLWANGDQVEMSQNLGELSVAVFQALANQSGGARIGALANGSLSGTNVQDQLYSLDESKTSAADLAANTGATGTGTNLVGGAGAVGPVFSLTAGTLKSQLEELLAHINSLLSISSGPTLVPTATLTGWSSNVYYARDNDRWGHVNGRLSNASGGNHVGPLLLFTLPVGFRPVFPGIRAIVPVYDVTLVYAGFAACSIQENGQVWLNSGVVAADNYLVLDLPSFKCSGL